MPNVPTRTARFVIAAAISACTLTTASGAALGVSSVEWVQPDRVVADWSTQVWSEARANDLAGVMKAISKVPDSVDEARVTGLRESIDLLLSSHEKRETRRAELLAEKRTALTEALAIEPETGQSLSDALRIAVEIDALIPGDQSVLGEAEIQDLIKRAEAEAHEAEKRSELLTASELFARLSMLMDDGITYRDDLERLVRRQALVRLYAPEAFYQLRNEHRLARGEEELPPFNPTGEDFKEKLDGINKSMIIQAVYRAVNQHIDPTQSQLRDLTLAGLEATRRLATTGGLETEFESLADEEQRSRFLAMIDREIENASADAYRPSFRELDAALSRVIQFARVTLGFSEEAVLHEFGVGAMAQLDDFSDIIWPHDLERFERQTRGNFKGVGIQIRMSETSDITVVTPIAGTPAQRAGIRSGDIIRKVNGGSTEGFTLDQAVDLITGPEDTSVTLTIERTIEEGAEEAEKNTIIKDFTITRTEINLPTVMGWVKKSPVENDWSWLIDEANGIGYVRLSGFTDNTSVVLDQAIRDLKSRNARGMILDLRFNPGGLLSQAVEISNRFIPEGTIVSTVDSRGQTAQRERAVAGKASMTGLPVIVLVNENSASASEIVSGAIQHYAEAGEIDALVLGQRSFGKGSVQNVYPLAGNEAYMKLTTQYYQLPSGRILHRKPGATEWGVEPDVHVDLLPEDITQMITIRQDADVIPLDENGLPLKELPPADPNRLLTEGIDFQLHTALVLMQTQVYNEQTSGSEKQALKR